ncbi:unnamed protein product [Calypogeia fissa]
MDGHGMEIERLIESTEDYLDLAIRSLNDLQLSSNELMFSTSEIAVRAEAPAGAASTSGTCEVFSSDSNAQAVTNDQTPSVEMNLSNASVSAQGSEWINMLMQQMSSATDIRDARMRATRVL